MKTRCGFSMGLTMVELGCLLGLAPVLSYAQTWTVSSSANFDGWNGGIEPAGSWQVPRGSSVDFTMVPAEYCHLHELKVNGVAAAVSSNSFYVPFVQADLQIEAVFLPILTSNGTPHFWLARHGLTNDGYEAESLLDSDGDGFANWEEWLASSNPTNPASHLANVHIGQLEDGSTVVQWAGRTNRSYGLWTRDDLADWKPDSDERIPLRWSWSGGGAESPYDPTDWKPDSDERIPLKYKPTDEDEDLPLVIKGYVTNTAGPSRGFFRGGAWRQEE